MKGIKRVKAEKGRDQRERLPISPLILKTLEEVWSDKKDDHDMKMIWAACCLCFFAFLRAGEMTVPSDKDYEIDPSTHLSVRDIVSTIQSTHPFFVSGLSSPRPTPFEKGWTSL